MMRAKARVIYLLITNSNFTLRPVELLVMDEDQVISSINFSLGHARKQPLRCASSLQ